VDFASQNPLFLLLSTKGEIYDYAIAIKMR